MPRRNTEPQAADSDSGIHIPESPCSDLKHGELLKDISGNYWRLGKTIGIGGFGQIYLVGEGTAKQVKEDTPYVCKVESHSNGPLFVEVNCYLRIAKPEMIQSWKLENNLQQLGMPYYITSGSCTKGSNKYRFLIIPRFETDLERVFKEKQKFNIKTVLTISIQILDILQYIHAKGYIHSDIKASNMLLNKCHPDEVKCSKLLNSQTARLRKLGSRLSRKLRPSRKVNYYEESIDGLDVGCKKKVTRNLRPRQNINYSEDVWKSRSESSLDDCESPAKSLINQFSDNSNQLYLVDFGLAAKYLKPNGQHKDCSEDERIAHAGTVLFCSRDAHKGVISRRSDLESLAYNMIYWLTGTLPWYNEVEEPELVSKKKIKFFANLSAFLQDAFSDNCPRFLHGYLSYLDKLEYETEPNYSYCKGLFSKAFKEYGYKNDGKFDFDNLEGWGCKQKKLKSLNENANSPRSKLEIHPLRLPLHSNSNNASFIKPLLRKKVKACQMNSMMNWSKILVRDPEIILKQANKTKDKDRRTMDDPGNLHLLNISQLNPTYAMLEVWSRWKERCGSSPSDRGDCIIPAIEGYTPAMMSVYIRMKERQRLEMFETVSKSNDYSSRSTPSRAAKRRVRSYKSSGRNFKNKLLDSNDSLRSKSVSRGSSTKSEKKDNGQLRKTKTVPMKRTYRLRG